ncbi:MAG: TIGR04283 family arsenosugar biosynthesis glycosyltransferase [Blastocatellia bacterium]
MKRGVRIRYSIIIPTLNEERTIRRQFLTIDTELSGGVEVIVADGGSDDQTVDLAKGHGWKTAVLKRGRGIQMNGGAEMATGEIILFLHADTFLPPDWAGLVDDVLADQRAVGGNFRLRFDGDSREAGWLTWLYPLLRRGGMCYGDSCFFLRRRVFEEVGGFRDYPIFEDCDLYQRVSRIGVFRTAAGEVTTSSRRFEGRFFTTFLLWVLLQLLYWLGVSPSRLGALYRICR